ncbi:MAG: Ribonuclease R [Succiniclasticum sp.]|jgi:ribonuclease R
MTTKETQKEKILEFMRRDAYSPMTAEEMLFAISGKEQPVADFWDALLELQEEGYIVKTRFNTYGLPERMGLVAGRFQLSSKGFGFVIPDNKGDRPDVFIPPRKIHGAMNNDRVMARIDTAVPGRKPEGDILRIVRRANDRIVGVFRKDREYGFVTPDDKRIGSDVYVAEKNFNGARDNQKVVVQITEWPTDRRNAEGTITEVLGNLGDPGLEILSIIKQHDLPLDFPENVKRAARRVPDISPADLKGRRDWRDLTVVTVDSEDARDLDDAVYVEQMKNGHYELGVFIADVSHYVKEGTLLDKEAARRGTSVYLVDRVLPMLPQRLSNGMCSLNEGEDRLVMGCEMEIDPKDGKILKYRISPGVIRSHHRLSYTIVREILEEGNAERAKQYKDIVPMLHHMEKLCRILQQKRARRGAIEFDLPEQKVILDEAGHPVEIKQRVHGLAESIIEEFMLAANETVARHLSMQHWPCVYRVHETPAADKMEGLAHLLASFGVRLALPQDGHFRPKSVQQALARLKGKPEERLANTVALRCMRQAVYQTDNVGHFGLAAEYYCHFTSPIRRYPDLLVHRLLHQWLRNPVLTTEQRTARTQSLEALAEHSSLQEREAIEAERETVDLKKAEYMQNFVGDEFDGVISGVTSFGIFVELPNGVEGLVHISSLTDDYYEYDEQGFRLVGTHTGKIYRLGDPLKIEVLRVNMEDRSIDFMLAGENEAMREYIRNQLERRGGKPSKADKSRAGQAQAAVRQDKGKAAEEDGPERNLPKRHHRKGRHDHSSRGSGKRAADPAGKKKKRRRR